MLSSKANNGVARSGCVRARDFASSQNGVHAAAEQVTAIELPLGSGLQESRPRKLLAGRFLRSLTRRVIII